jgi:hypothetical protein
MADKSLRCRLGRHMWETRRDAEGGRYVACLKCGKEQDKITLANHPGMG